MSVEVGASVGSSVQCWREEQPWLPWAIPAGCSVGHSVSFHKVLHAQEEEKTKFQPHRQI